MNSTINDVLTFVKENDVKFIRLSFCDLFGVHKNIAIMADQLKDAFALILAAGFEGIEKKMDLPPPVDASAAKDKSRFYKERYFSVI